MITQPEIFAEVKAAVDAAIGAGQVVQMTWLVQQVVAVHSAIKGEDRDWYTCNAYENVRATARKVLRGYEPAEETDEQLTFGDGFIHLQKAYPCLRDGERCIVPIDQMTDDDIDAKCNELDAMAVGCLEHKRELQRYKAARRGAAE